MMTSFVSYCVICDVLQLQFTLEPGPVAINCTAFNHNGNLLVTGAADGIIRLLGENKINLSLSILIVIIMIMCSCHTRAVMHVYIHTS